MATRFKLLIIIMALLAFAFDASAQKASKKTQEFDVDKQLEYCNNQIHKALKLLQRSDGTYDFTMEPRNIPYNNHKVQTPMGWTCRKVSAEEWCSGFWPGILWMDYSVFNDENIKKAAEGYTESLHDIAYRPIFDHDIGFLMFCSYGKGYAALDATLKNKEERIKNKEDEEKLEEYKKVIQASSDSLAILFNPMVGTFLSWPRNVKMFGGHNTIMDNMMNLDMLFWASKHGGNPLLYDLAVMHAKTTMEHHFRKDGGCYHVAVYDSIDGHFIKGVTHQGYADSSMWARGQSWAIYGYTMVYRYTHNPIFLKFAEKVTDAYLRKLGVKGEALKVKCEELVASNCNHKAQSSTLKAQCDLIPAWDFDDPDPKAPKDASAACVVADALLELCNYVCGEKGQFYHDLAVEMLAQLSTPEYLSGDRNVSFLMHSTGHHPAGSEIDYSIIYADYYYLEALIRLKNEK